MSPKMSSLAYDDIQELNLEDAGDFQPDLHVVNSRYVSRCETFPTKSMQEDVVLIRGKFTVSF